MSAYLAVKIRDTILSITDYRRFFNASFSVDVKDVLFSTPDFKPRRINPACLFLFIFPFEASTWL